MMIRRTFVRKAMTIEVCRNLLRKALIEHAEMPLEDPADLTMQIISIIKILKKQKRVKKRDRQILQHAIHLRLVALSRLHDRPETRLLERAGQRWGVPAQTAPTTVVVALVGQYGQPALAGYGLDARLEFLMLPVVFGIGAALTAIGRRQCRRREKRAMDRCTMHARPRAKTSR